MFLGLVMSVCNSNDTVDVNCVYIETLEAQLLSIQHAQLQRSMTYNQ